MGESIILTTPTGPQPGRDHDLVCVHVYVRSNWQLITIWYVYMSTYVVTGN